MLLTLLCVVPFSSPAPSSPAPSSPAWLVPVAELLAPFVDDRPDPTHAQRFPSADVCRQAMAVNRVYRDWLYARADFFPSQADTYLSLIAETERRYHVWDWALAVAGGCPGWTVEASLAGLRQRLGPADYHAGRLPAALPVE